ncbi:hypothetical protein [Halostagnicola bangensis]
MNDIINEHFKRFALSAIAIGIVGSIINMILTVIFFPLGIIGAFLIPLAIAYVLFMNVAFMADEIAKTA